MAAKKFLRLVSGRVTEILGVTTSAGAGNDGDIPALDSSGRLDQSMMPIGVGETGMSFTASETLAAGDIVNIHDSTGAKARKADATAAGKEGYGFVESGISAAASGTVYFSGVISGLAGLTVGARYYLATAAGTITATPPSSAGNIVQFIGVALSATELLFQPDVQPVTVA